MDKPWHLYITNGATKCEELEFEDRKHFILHYDQVDDIRMYICGREFATFSCNVQLTFEEFWYVVSRLRYYTVPAEIRSTPFPIYAANWEDGRARISIGKDGFTIAPAGRDMRLNVWEAWEDYWHNY